MKETIVTIDENAGVTIQTKGFAGRDCKTDAGVIALKKALGEVTEETATAEMNQTKSQDHGNRSKH